MKLIGAMFCATVICAAGLHAQSSETQTKSKVTIKDGKEVNVTGCVEPAAGGKGFVLTNVADKSGALHNYTLVSGDDDLAKHVGHRVQLTGKVTDRGDASIRIDTKEKTKVEHGDDKETHSKTEVKGDGIATAYLGVQSLKMIAATCP